MAACLTSPCRPLTDHRRQEAAQLTELRVGQIPFGDYYDLTGLPSESQGQSPLKESIESRPAAATICIRRRHSDAVVVNANPHRLFFGKGSKLLPCGFLSYCP